MMGKRLTFVTAIFILALLPLSSCAPGKGGDRSSDFTENTGNVNAVEDLIAQSHFFEGVPKELYWGRVLQEACSDQGVAVKYRAAFSDGEAVYLFFDVTDEGAGLFTDNSNGYDFTLEEYDFLEKTGYTDSRQYELVSYDKKTKTATLCVEYIGPLQDNDITFHVYSMNGNQQEINAALDGVNLYEMLEKTTGEFEEENQFREAGTGFGVFDEKTGETRNIEMPDFDDMSGDSIYRLKKNMLAIPVKDERGVHVADITNIGWRNRWLHVQIDPENDIVWNANFNLKHNKTGELVYSPFNIAFGGNDDGEQNDYYEYMFYVGDLTKENLDYSIVFRHSTYRAADLKGDWTLRFSVSGALVKRLEAGKTIPVKGHDLFLERAVVSPVKITLFAPATAVPADLDNWFRSVEPDDLEMKLVYQNGRTAEIPKQSGYTHGNQKGDLFRITYTAENFDDITGMEINGIFFPAAE